MTNIYTIYKATNLINEKCYIGFDSAWPRRQKVHLSRPTKFAFSAALQKHGPENFIWEILYQSLDGDHTLNVMEGYFIAENQSFGVGGYNMTLGGEGRLGCIPSAEHRAKNSTANKGKTRSAETRAKMSAANKGKKLSAEHIAKRTAARKNSKTVSTPFGVFESLARAATELHLHPSTIDFRIKSDKFPEWKNK